MEGKEMEEEVMKDMTPRLILDLGMRYATERSNLIKAIWKYLLEEYKTEISQFNTQKSGLETGITNIEIQYKAKISEYKTLDTEIKNLNKNANQSSLPITKSAIVPS